MNAMKREQAVRNSRPRHGTVLHLSEEDYRLQVRDATPPGNTEVHVVLLLYVEASETCQLLLQHYKVFATRFTHLKCCKMLATEAHKDYPAEKIPSLFVYHNGGISTRLFGLEPYGGIAGLQAAGATAIAKCLVYSGAIEMQHEEND